MSGNHFQRQLLSAAAATVTLLSSIVGGAQVATNGVTALLSVPPQQTNTAVLQLSDGSLLHGTVARIDAGNAIQWLHPAADEPLRFTITNIARIRFEQPVVPIKNDQSNCRFHFFNGDEITGNLTWMDGAKAGVETWFAGNLEAARGAVQSIEFSKRGFSVLYEGPTGLDGWTTGHTARSWTYQDGTLMANGADILGRDFKLTGSSILEFDIAWGNSFSLSLSMYTSSIDRYDYNSSAYMFYLSPGMVSLQRIQAGAGVVLLGQSSIPAMMKKNRAHLEIRSSKEEASLILLVNGVVVQRWHDSAGFVGKGGGIVFFSQIDGPSLKLSNIRVSEWDGRSDRERGTNAPANADLVFLGNRDKVSGKIDQIKDGKVNISAGELKLNIPLERVTQIFLSNNEAPAEPERPWQVRAFFSGGEKVAFRLKAAEQGAFTGESQNFGGVRFDARAVRQLQFNLRRPSASSESTPLVEDEAIEGDE